ncbi:FtsW/RodA/SpoVE family cell cycle protein [Cohnella rhizosphaerae]|uniref:FtsW/RodA/SpoVE family cell cycle protein n=1 Tax=Cohnella rhizosphaerae TaxID=1457232 RepID=UPI0030B8A5CA
MLNRLKKIDLIMLLCLFGFMAISALLVRSATSMDAGYSGKPMQQLIFYCIGFVLILLTTLFNYRLLLKTWYVWYGLGLALLVAVYLFATPVNGAKSWFELPGNIQFQPAEVVKIFLIITVAWLMGRRQGDPLSMRKDVLLIAAVSFVPFFARHDSAGSRQRNHLRIYRARHVMDRQRALFVRPHRSCRRRRRNFAILHAV